MSKKELFVITYKKDIVNGPEEKVSLFWGPGDNWVKDPKTAIQFTKDHAIMEVGRLLVEQEWITKLVPLSEIPETRSPSPPSNNFIVIVDNEGIPVECFSRSSVNNEFLLGKTFILDKEHPEYAPHSVWQRDHGGFTRLFDPQKQY